MDFSFHQKAHISRKIKSGIKYSECFKNVLCSGNHGTVNLIRKYVPVENKYVS